MKKIRYLQIAISPKQTPNYVYFHKKCTEDTVIAIFVKLSFWEPLEVYFRTHKLFQISTRLDSSLWDSVQLDWTSYRIEWVWLGLPKLSKFCQVTWLSRISIWAQVSSYQENDHTTHERDISEGKEHNPFKLSCIWSKNYAWKYTYSDSFIFICHK